MDIYCTIEERYIQATEELSYGETAKALQLLNELLKADPSYARTYFQLGIINYYHIKDYQVAGYYFSKCIEIEPGFPDVYEDFIKLLVFLNMDKKAKLTASNALKIAGVDHRLIYQQLGLLEEKGQNWRAALDCYRKAYAYSLSKEGAEESTADIERAKDKLSRMARFVYNR
jgi:tetratricopeptide (TPR) repeat protein